MLLTRPAGVIWRSYYYSGAARIAMREDSDAGSEVYYILTDHLGSTAITYRINGGLVSRQWFTPWGETRPGSSVTATDYAFTGQLEDKAIGLYWYRSRWYDPALSRFAQPDSVVPLASQGVQAWDRFAYVNNSPMNHVDPTGHGCEDLPEGVRQICISAREQIPTPTPTYTLTPTPTQTPTPTNTPTLTSTPCELPKWEAASTRTPTIAPTVRDLRWISGPTYTPTPYTRYENDSSEPSFISVDWNKIDWIDLSIDFVGIGLDVSTIIFPHAAVPIQAISDVIEGGGLVKSSYELITGDPRSMLIQHADKTAKNLAIFSRSTRLIPYVGIFFNAISIYINVSPAISINP